MIRTCLEPWNKRGLRVAMSSDNRETSGSRQLKVLFWRSWKETHVQMEEYSLFEKDGSLETVWDSKAHRDPEPVRVGRVVHPSFFITTCP